jgi:hypothetical protein
MYSWVTISLAFLRPRKLQACSANLPTRPHISTHLDASLETLRARSLYRTNPPLRLIRESLRLSNMARRFLTMTAMTNARDRDPGLQLSRVSTRVAQYRNPHLL